MTVSLTLDICLKRLKSIDQFCILIYARVLQWLIDKLSWKISSWEPAEESEQVNKEWWEGVSIWLIKLGKFPKILRANYRNHSVRVNSISFGRAFSDERLSTTAKTNEYLLSEYFLSNFLTMSFKLKKEQFLHNSERSRFKIVLWTSINKKRSQFSYFLKLFVSRTISRAQGKLHLLLTHIFLIVNLCFANCKNYLSSCYAFLVS